MTPWRLRRDPYLAPLVARHGEQAAWDAGFFVDADPDDAPLDDVDWLCTPRPKRPVSGVRPVVLLATGGFFPVHGGHLAMLEAARTAATAAGFDVVGGYLSPGHDDYLRLKCGGAAIPASERLAACAAAVAGSDWLSVDPWEALHRRVAVNFTDVAARLRSYLRAHVHPDLDVLYVCGGDNARFALAFTERGGCVVVGRPGAEAEVSRWRRRLAGHPRVLWADGDHPAASRDLRVARSAQAPAPARLVLRLEDDRAVATLGLPSFDRFQRALVAVLEQVATVRTVPLSTPAEAGPVLSLDPLWPGDLDLAVSRLFALGGYEALGHVPRPGAAALVDQVAAIAPGRYVLRDDDRVSGATLAAVLALLPPDVVVDATRFAVTAAAGEEVADSRDFLLGADHGGLVVALPGGGVGRAPYALPYVDPSVRCCVPADQVHAFSRAVWTLNLEAFEGTGLRVADLPPPARATLAGLGDGRLLADVCGWHLDRLAALAPPPDGV